MDWFWYIPGPVAVVAYVGFYVWSRRQSASAISEAAQKRGWTYAEKSRLHARRYSGWPFDGKGLQARNLVTGHDRGREFVAYELSSRIGIEYKYANDGLLRNRCRYQVVSVSHGLPSTPVLTVRSQDPLVRASEAVGVGTADVGHDQFDREFEVSTQDSTQMKKILTDQLCSWLLADPRASKVPLRFEGGDVVTWRSGALDIDEVVDVLDYLNDVVDRLPGS